MLEFGDAEAACVDVVHRAAGVIAFDPVVSANLVGLAQHSRWVRVRRTGGIPTRWMRLDNPKIEFEVYAEEKGVAFDLASAARTAVFGARGAYTGHGLALYDVTDDTGLAYDPDTSRPTLARYTFTLSLVTRPI